jgi:catechol 2,3-dioxygenase-like lactoylglutathione lyase family enzyme
MDMKNPIDTPQILGIDVVFIHTKNPVKLAQWYKEHLGLEIGFSTSDMHWQEFDFNQDISTTRFALDSIGEEPSEVEEQPIMISFKVADIEDSVKKLESKGVEFYGKEKINDVGPTLIAIFQDLDGNWIQISQKKQ